MSHHHHDGHDHEHDEARNGGHSHDHDPADRGIEASLFKQIHIDKIRSLNEHEEGAGSKIFKSWDKRFAREPYLESDADQQLIIFVPFTGMVKLKSILILGGPGGMMPKTLKVFTNREDVDFDNVDSIQPLQEWELIDTTALALNDTGVPEYPTRMSKFTSVRNISLYISSNYGDDITRISYIGFKGEWTEFKKDPIITIYEAAPNPTDHVKLKDRVESMIQ
ncbi:hypothetical protein SeMB42_g01734 [Synchytrium endobioticum]|uniref:PITH domain-containing protein n=1 Tax=Synchytrium endobioticum TaxID=286115 RepID=A0A507DBW8_9FUNG|nr:hypothetical protein SeLEV6574_g01670 [Synchytrium endobioticum]TPX51958.1 hypothetical protein SeMB42_g01734 [Synchytrium endobioticum]